MGLLGGLYHDSQITLVLPYFPHDRFKTYMHDLSLEQVRQYMHALFIALKHLHSHRIIHRDVKPSNFLHSVKRSQYLLVDFGLAEIDETSSILPSHEDYNRHYGTCNSTTNDLRTSASNIVTSTNYRGSLPSILTSSSDQLPSIQNPTSGVSSRKAGRAGTRGFRAPEVLMRSTHQTVALDMWSAGVVLLCILSGRYPFFSSPDDMTALAEISCLCGTSELCSAAMALKKRLVFSEPREKVDWRTMCERLSNFRHKEFPDEIYDLLGRCLDPNPFTRINSSEALLHPFLRPLSTITEV